jgi:hypothetical protein
MISLSRLWLALLSSALSHLPHSPLRSRRYRWEREKGIVVSEVKSRKEKVYSERLLWVWDSFYLLWSRWRAAGKSLSCVDKTVTSGGFPIVSICFIIRMEKEEIQQTVNFELGINKKRAFTHCVRHLKLRRNHEHCLTIGKYQLRNMMYLLIIRSKQKM